MTQIENDLQQGSIAVLIKFLVLFVLSVGFIVPVKMESNVNMTSAVV